MTSLLRFAGNGLRLLLGILGPAALLFLLAPPSALGQCALCRDAVAAASSQTREAMNYAIIGLAFTPYVVVALAAWTLSPALRAGVRAWFTPRTVRGAGSPP